VLKKLRKATTQSAVVIRSGACCKIDFYNLCRSRITFYRLTINPKNFTRLKTIKRLTRLLLNCFKEIYKLSDKSFSFGCDFLGWTQANIWSIIYIQKKTTYRATYKNWKSSLCVFNYSRKLRSLSKILKRNFTINKKVATYWSLWALAFAVKFKKTAATYK